MKTAYQLAMERLAKAAPTVTLSTEQKAEIAELESRHKAKVAERELAANAEIEKAEAAGEAEAADKARQQLATDRRRFQEELEAKKAAIRKRI